MSPHDTHPDRSDVIDLRSDTLTQPTDRMRQAMADAEVADALFGEDPTMRRLEEHAARVLGKEAALFFPTGSMANLAAILVHTGGRKEVIADRRAHVFNYETGSIHAVAGCGMWPIDATGGVYSPEMLEAAIRPRSFVHATQGLVVIENTVNGWGGNVWTPAETQGVADTAHAHDLPVHLDGARIFNSAVAQGVPAARLAEEADSIMFCFSKGLSAPIGSILVGDADLIDDTVPIRKQLGGAMRQTGHLAAAAQVALDTMVDRLAEDHTRARRLAAALAENGHGIDPERTKTNILVFDVRPAGFPDAAGFLEAAAAHGIRALPVSPHEVRFVTHRHITDEKIQVVLDALPRLRP